MRDVKEMGSGSLVLLRRLDVGGHGRSQEAEFGGVGGHVDIETLGAGERSPSATSGKRGKGQNVLVVGRRLVSSKARRQALVHLAVDDLGRLGERELAEHVEREPGLFHRLGDRGRLEVAAMVGVVAFEVEQRAER